MEKSLTLGYDIVANRWAWACNFPLLFPTDKHYTTILAVATVAPQMRDFTLFDSFILVVGRTHAFLQGIAAHRETDTASKRIAIPRIEMFPIKISTTTPIRAKKSVV